MIIFLLTVISLLSYAIDKERINKVIYNLYGGSKYYKISYREITKKWIADKKVVKIDRLRCRFGEPVNLSFDRVAIKVSDCESLGFLKANKRAELISFVFLDRIEYYKIEDRIPSTNLVVINDVIVPLDSKDIVIKY